MLWSFWPLGTCSPTSLLHQTLSVLLAPAGRSTLECIRAPPHLPPAWLRHHLEQNLLGMVLAFLKRCFRHSASQNRIPFSIFFFFFEQAKANSQPPYLCCNFARLFKVDFMVIHSRECPQLYVSFYPPKEPGLTK